MMIDSGKVNCQKMSLATSEWRLDQYRHSPLTIYEERRLWEMRELGIDVPMYMTIEKTRDFISEHMDEYNRKIDEKWIEEQRVAREVAEACGEEYDPHGLML